jgi:hypothetical protein
LKQARKRIRIQLMANAFGTAIFMFILWNLSQMSPGKSSEIFVLMGLGFLLQLTVIVRLLVKLLSLNREIKQW